MNQFFSLTKHKPLEFPAKISQCSYKTTPYKANASAMWNLGISVSPVKFHLITCAWIVSSNFGKLSPIQKLQLFQGKWSHSNVHHYNAWGKESAGGVRSEFNLKSPTCVPRPVASGRELPRCLDRVRDSRGRSSLPAPCLAVHLHQLWLWAQCIKRLKDNSYTERICRYDGNLGMEPLCLQRDVFGWDAFVWHWSLAALLALCLSGCCSVHRISGWQKSTAVTV